MNILVTLASLLLTTGPIGQGEITPTGFRIQVYPFGGYYGGYYYCPPGYYGPNCYYYGYYGYPYGPYYRYRGYYYGGRRGHGRHYRHRGGRRRH